MEHIIKAAVERGASDLHIKAGDVFRARIDGQLRPLTKQRLTPDQTKAIALELIPNESVRDAIDTLCDYDFSWGAPGIGRFRVNLLRQRSSFMIVMRAIPFDVPSIQRLRLPRVLERIGELSEGLVLIVGPSGGGKSSTVAALVHHINSSMHKHIITVERPIEFLHRDLNSSVTQREVGVDTETFTAALHATLRQDPDVVVVQDLVDEEMVDTALTAAETGRLVISTLHTPDAVSSVARLIAMFPPEEREVVRARLADVTQAVVAQRLLPCDEAPGRRVAAEVLLGTPAVKDILRDRNRAADLYDVVAAGRHEHGMQTLDQHLVDLVGERAVSVATARAAAANPGEFDRLCALAEGHPLDEAPERRLARRDRRRATEDRRRAAADDGA